MSWHPTDERVASALARLRDECAGMSAEQLRCKLARLTSPSARAVVMRELTRTLRDAYRGIDRTAE